MVYVYYPWWSSFVAYDKGVLRNSRSNKYYRVIEYRVLSTVTSTTIVSCMYVHTSIYYVEVIFNIQFYYRSYSTCAVCVYVRMYVLHYIKNMIELIE